MPQLTWGGRLDRRNRPERMDEIAEENLVRGLPLNQQVQTRLFLMGNSRFRT
jgi:hypothetical protein